MMRTYTMRLKASRNQSQRLDRLLDQLCAIYNMALEQRKTEWEQSHVALTYYDQQAELVELRAWFPEYAELPSAIERDPLRRLQRAFDGFFRRLKAGEIPGYPRFRSRDRYDSFTVDAQSFRMEDGQVVIVGFGGFRFKTHALRLVTWTRSQRRTEHTRAWGKRCLKTEFYTDLRKVVIPIVCASPN